MSGRGREATLPAWMASGPQPSGAPGRPALPPGAAMPFGGAPSPVGWPSPMGAPPQQQPNPAQGMAAPFQQPPGSGPAQQPLFPGMHGHPHQAPVGGPAPASQQFPGPPAGQAPPASATPAPGQPGRPGAGAPGRVPGPGAGSGPGVPPTGPPGSYPPAPMQPMMPQHMWLPPGAAPPPLLGPPPFGMMGAGRGMPLMPPQGMVLPGPGQGLLPPGAGMMFPGLPPPGQQLQQPQQQQQQQQPQQQQQQPSNQSAAAPSGQAAGAGKSPWTEHTAPDGRKYYFNQQSKQSSWEKPADLQSSQEKAEATAWKEHTAPDGRKYYYNKDTKESKWSMPEELKRAKGATAASAAPATAAGPSPSADAGKATTPEPTPRGTPTPTPTPESAAADKLDASKYQYATKAEAKDAFKELLAAVGCHSDWSWEQALKLIVNDPRYPALKSVGEKKACFNEYIQQRRNQDKEDERKRLRQARADLLKLIVHSKELKLTHSYRRAKEILGEEPLWKAVPDREREDLYQEGLKEKDKKEKEERKLEKQRKGSAFRALLENAGVKLGSEWRKVCAKLEGEDAHDDMEKVDRLEVFQEYQKELERREREEKDKDKEARRREDRRARDAFKELLARHRAQGLIHVKSRWHEYSKHVVAEEEYKALERSSSGSRPKELFEYLVEDLEKEFEEAKAVMKELMRQGGVEVSPSSSFEDFFSQLQQVEEREQAKGAGDSDEQQQADGKDEGSGKEDSKLSRIDADLKLVFFEELIGKAKAREVEEAERKKRAQDKFASMLRHLRKLDADTSWEQFVEDYDREPEFRALGADEGRPIFDEYMVKLNRKAEKRRKGSDDEGSDASRERIRKRSAREREEDSEEEGQRKHKKKGARRHERSDDDDDEERKARKKKHKDSKSRNRDREKDRSSSRQRGEAEGAAPANGDADGPAPSDKAE